MAECVLDEFCKQHGRKHLQNKTWHQYKQTPQMLSRFLLLFWQIRRRNEEESHAYMHN